MQVEDTALPTVAWREKSQKDVSLVFDLLPSLSGLWQSPLIAQIQQEAPRQVKLQGQMGAMPALTTVLGRDQCRELPFMVPDEG